MRFAANMLPFVCCFVCFLASCVAGVALANGRYPEAGLIVALPGAPPSLAVRTTYGMVVTHDNGMTWQWICEGAMGYGGTDDPFFVYAGNGGLVASTFKGFRFASQDGCSWATGPVEAMTGQVRALDLARDPRNLHRLVAIALDEADAAYVLETIDDGQTWRKLGVPLPLFHVPLTIDVAAKDGKLYVTTRTGANLAEQVLMRSNDNGATWVALPFSPTQTDAAGQPLSAELTPVVGTYLGGIDPLDSNTLYLRVDRQPDDQMWQSTDGGVSWTKRLHLGGPLLAFALAPDGLQWVAGGVLPTPGVFAGTKAPGVASPRSNVGVRCLTWTAGGLFACTDELAVGFTVGKSQDGGGTFAALHKRKELSLLACPTGTSVRDFCNFAWTFQAKQLGIAVDPVPVPPPHPTPTPAASGCASSPPSPLQALPEAICLMLLAAAASRLAGRRRDAAESRQAQ